ncbi:IQ domain-containing protein F5-like [Microtus ochrogaster]|uniref:IQ domain-containing protein F5-like n=1 Tax=Microtus ochrogaster TaxID=79684 RepID=A0ABM0KK11_MICOH|nr:IQ domain-containing protein F5-like [Microtus ochrogaster]
MGCLCGVIKAKEIPVEEEPNPQKINKKSKSIPLPAPKFKKTLPLPKLPSKTPSYKKLAAKKIQAWWRGTLVRRTLLKAALSAWIIQCWWRKILARKLEKRRLLVLHLMAQETRACVTIQSWVRMLQSRQQYCRLLYATHVIQVSWRWYNCHTRGLFQGSYELTGNQLSLQLDIFLGSQICRISDCIPLPIKN